VISAVSRVAQILEVLAEHPKGLSVTDLAKTLDAGKPMISRVLATLPEAGYVHRDPTSERYGLRPQDPVARPSVR
jgi:IclR family KDG regulon transcriptional repressor